MENGRSRLPEFLDPKVRIKIVDAKKDNGYLILTVKFDFMEQDMELIYSPTLRPDDLRESLISDYKGLRKAQGRYEWNLSELKGAEIDF